MTVKSYQEQSAVDALKKATEYAVAPFIFQGICAMKDLGILALLEKNQRNGGISKGALASELNISNYAVSVLIDLGVAADILIENDDKYTLSKVGIYLSSDRMTNINLDFSRDVCYEGLSELTSSLKNSKAEGLKYFTKEHETIYPFLGSLPSKAQSSWFGFDHFYSDHIFLAALKEIFSKLKVSSIYDVGGNTGKFALEATSFNPNVKVTIIDLPEQCALAQQNIIANNLQDRIFTHPVNMLSANPDLPSDADVWWMSQFLDCFAIADVKRILINVSKAMKNDAVLVVNELFGDRQANDIARLIIDSTSLYFTAIANGKSRFYHAKEFLEAVNEAGLELMHEVSGFGVGHTLLFLQKKKA